MALSVLYKKDSILQIYHLPKFKGKTWTVTVPDLTGMDRKTAEQTLKKLGLSCLSLGEGDVVTNQLPAPGEILPGGSGMLVYFDAGLKTGTVTVPDFADLTPEEAELTAAEAGLCVRTTGNPDRTLPLRVLTQSIEPGTEVSPGTVIELQFTHRTARD